LEAYIKDLLARRLETAADREAEALRPKLRAAQERLEELRAVSAEAWQDLKPGLQKAWEEMYLSLNQASSKFKTKTNQYRPP
jgi:hypothetical protein